MKPFVVERELAERGDSLEAGYVVEDQGLVVTRALSDQEWADLGARLVRRRDGSTWAIGDWLVYGGRGEPGNRWVGSTMYEQAAKITGLSVNYLTNLFGIANHYPRDQRVPGASFSHHKHVLRNVEDAKEGQRWLKQSAENRWSFDELMSRIEAARPPGEVPIPRAGRRRTGGTMVTCPGCKHTFPVRGNKTKGRA